MIPTYCRNDHLSSASANAHAVVTVTTEAGSLHRVEGQCDQCPEPTSALVSSWEAQAVRWVLSARHELARLRDEQLRARRN